MAAQPYIAQWIGEHPKWTAVKWRCEYQVATGRHSGEAVWSLGLNIRLHEGFRGYVLQSFRSLSAIENTASALISMSRTKQCFAPG